MKRTMARLCCMPLLLAAGCETLPKQTANRMTGSFTVGVTVTSADSEIKGELTRCGMDVWSVVFTDPPALSGVQLDFTAEEVRASYKGLEFSVPQSAQAIRTELCMFMDVVDDLAQTPAYRCASVANIGGYTQAVVQQGFIESDIQGGAMSKNQNKMDK